MALAPRELWEFCPACSADELRFAILADDAKTVSKAPGIGKKTAQKLILELRDKLSLEEAFEQKLSHETAGIVVSSERHDGCQKRSGRSIDSLGIQQHRGLCGSAICCRGGSGECGRDSESC